MIIHENEDATTWWLHIDNLHVYKAVVHLHDPMQKEKKNAVTFSLHA